MRWLVMIVSLSALLGCERQSVPVRSTMAHIPAGNQLEQNLDRTCVADYQPGVNYFPEQTHFQWSNQLSVEYGLHYKKVSFVAGVDNGESLEFLLVQCGTPVPEHAPDSIVIQVPIQRLATGNSAMLGAADELNMVDLLVGIENIRTPTVSSVRERIASGHIQELWGYGHANIEPIIAARPDVYLSFYSAYPQFNLHPQLQRMGVRALPQADHLEGHPLGRAEWLKLLALLTNREQRANSRFASIERQYLDWARLAASAEHRPLVMVGAASGRDSFEVFGGLNQRARLISDGGGRYVMEGSPHRGSWIHVSFEQIYALGAKAPVWLGAQPGYPRLEHLLAASPRSNWFQAARDGQVFAFDEGYIGAWASPYNDNSMTRPHKALADLIRALHPELVRDGTPSTFLRQLP